MTSPVGRLVLECAAISDSTDAATIRHGVCQRLRRDGVMRRRATAGQPDIIENVREVLL